MSQINDIKEKAEELGMGKIGAIRPEALDGYFLRLDERARKLPLGGGDLRKF
jgi:hypothetical protein